MKKTTEEFRKEVDKVSNGTLWFEGEYVTNKTHLLFHCNVCGHSWMLRPDKFVIGRRCPECARIKKLKTNEEFIKEVYLAVGDEYTFLDDYVNTSTKIKVIHNTCGKSYYVTPHNFLDVKNRCPFCSHSNGENKIRDWLEDNRIKYIREYSPDWIKPRRYRYDFFIPEDNLIIEYHGIQHYKDNNWFKTKANEYQETDVFKKEKALEHGIRYLIIPYWEYNKIEEILRKEENK